MLDYIIVNSSIVSIYMLSFLNFLLLFLILYKYIFLNDLIRLKIQMVFKDVNIEHLVLVDTKKKDFYKLHSFKVRCWSIYVFIM